MILMGGGLVVPGPQLTATHGWLAAGLVGWRRDGWLAAGLVGWRGGRLGAAGS
jgi:hypothetical protein